MTCSEKALEYEYEKIPVQENIPDEKLKYGFGVRHTQLAIILLCLTVNIIGRGHMGVSIVAMTDVPKDNTIVSKMKINVTKSNSTEVVDTLARHELGLHITSGNPSIEEVQIKNITNRSYNTYKWPKSVQEMVLNSFFLGYSIMMFPMGIVCQRYGGKLPLQIALLINGIVSIVTPWLTLWGGWKAVCGCRILQGLSQAGTYPSIQAQLAKWASVSELATLSSYVHTGSILGTVVAFQLAGFLGESRWGWPSTFYTFGVISFLCFMLLTIYGATSPAEHKTISDEEKKYIMRSSKDGHARVADKKLKTPWRSMVTSKPLWAVLIAQLGSHASYVFFFNQVPSYIHNILGINVKNSGLLSSLPYIASFFTCIGFGWISDYCTNKNIISLKNARRIFNTIAFCGLAICLICASYAHSNTVAVTCLVVAMATHVGVHTGWMVNHIDLAPNFTGTIMATTSSLSLIIVLLTPVVISYVVTDTANVTQWRIMFFIIAGLCITTNAIFVFLVSSDVQPWNHPDYNKKCSKQPKEVTMEEGNK